MEILRNTVLSMIHSKRERQKKSKRKLIIERFELDVIATIGSAREYNQLGGYKEVEKALTQLEQGEIIQEIPKKSTTKKNKSYWILPKYSNHAWDKAEMAKAMTYLNLTFYLRNRNLQTEDEWELVTAIYEFMKYKSHHTIVKREQRSLMLFHHLHLQDNVVPEKFLGSNYGKKLLQRLRLSLNDLLCEVAFEPFQYWRNKAVPNQYTNEVLVVEGLNTYQTIEEILKKRQSWIFGPIPHLLIWGEGYRIENTLEYIYEIMGNPKELTIRYAGDIDYEGFMIFFNLKRRYKQLHLVFAKPFYSFLLSVADKYSTPVLTEQRVKQEYFLLLQKELQDEPKILERITKLWQGRKRIAQEWLNLETLSQRGETDE